MNRFKHFNHFNLIVAIFLAVLMGKSQAQTTQLFCDDFDSPGSNVFGMIRYSIPANAPVMFTKDSVIRKGNSGFSATDTVGFRTTSYLMTPKIGINGFLQLTVSFDQICYIDWYDEGIVEYSFDGNSWNRFPVSVTNNGINEQVYLGPSAYQAPQNSFSKLSNSQLWRWNDSAYIWTPSNSINAWKTEIFDVIPLVDQYNNINGFPPDSMQIRLGLKDNPASPVGHTGTHRWWIDNFCVNASTTVGLESFEESEIIVLPNPVVDYIRIENLNLSSSVEYRIHSINGKCVQSGLIERNLINAQNLENGVYFLDIQLPEGNLVKRFIKQ